MSVHIDNSFTRALTGRRIESVTKVDVNGDVWPGLTLDDGSILIIQRDAGGNGGGHMVLEKGDTIVGEAGYTGEGP